VKAIADYDSNLSGTAESSKNGAMRVPCHRANSFLIQFTVLALGIISWQCHAALAQKTPERFWLAGRYDGDRVIVYFNAVQFHGTVPTTAKRIADPVVGGFFMPEELPTSYIAQFLKTPDVEHFALGDKYDLLLDYGKVATVTLTTLVGTEGDEEVGNDSFIGALATFENNDDPMHLASTGGIYVIRRPRKLLDDKSKSLPRPDIVYAGLQNEPVRFDIQTKIVGLLTDQMRNAAKADRKLEVAGMSPVFAVQAFHLANGKLRYYARAVWNSGEGANTKTVFALSAWISPSPTLHILAVEGRESPYDGLGVLPDLYNVVDLGGGRTGIIVGRSGEDDNSTVLLEYRDGVDLRQMRILQSIGAGE
jgi:hypothetical protein